MVHLTCGRVLHGLCGRRGWSCVLACTLFALCCLFSLDFVPSVTDVVLKMGTDRFLLGSGSRPLARKGLRVESLRN